MIALFYGNNYLIISGRIIIQNGLAFFATHIPAILDIFQDLGVDLREIQIAYDLEHESLQRSLSANENAQERQKLGYERNYAAANRTRGAIADLGSELDKTAKAVELLNNNLYQSGLKLDEWGKNAQKSGKQIQDIGQGIQDVFAPLTALSVPILAAGAAGVKASIDFESAFTGVTKTIGMTAEETDAMRQSIIDMSNELPHTKEEISGVAQAAGQLGIKKDDILKFTEVMLNMGVATDMSAESAADSMARFANITGLSADKYENLGSVIVDLGNNFATTESEITEMGLRLAAAGSQIGLSEAEILGFAAALSSVGMAADAGGSAFSKTMKQMQAAVETSSESLGNYAEVAKMTSEEFAELFKASPAEALKQFIIGLGDVEGAGKSTILMLDELGINEIRQSDAMARLAGSTENLGAALDVATTAFDENIALQKEADKFNNTAANKLEVLKNNANSLAVELGDRLIPAGMNLLDKYIKPAIEKLGNLDEKQKENIITGGAWIAALGTGGKILGGAVEGFGKFTESMGKAASGIGEFIKKQQSGESQTGVFAKALGFIASPAGLAAAAVLALGAGIAYAVIEAQKGSEAMRKVADMSDKLAETQRKVAEEVAAKNKEIADSYKIMATDVDVFLLDLKSRSATITEEISSSMKEKVNGLGQSITESIQTNTSEAVGAFQNTFMLDGIIDEEERKILSKIETGGASRRY